ncbi:MAG: AI-2E family transporter [Vicinamibacterales bacterium]
MTSGAIARAVAIITLAALVLVVLYTARDALLVVYVSVLLATGLGPLVRRIELAVPPGVKRLPRWLAILLIYVIIVGLLTMVGLLVVPPMVEQAQGLWRQLPDMFERAQRFVVSYGLLDHRITLEEAVRNAPGPGQAVGTVASAVGTVFTGVLGFLTVLILTFYLLVESETLFAAFVRLFPRGDRTRVEEVSLKISSKISAWLSGQLMLGGTIGLTAAAGLYLLGVPYFYVLALLAGLGEMVPVVGPIFAAIPAVAVALSVSPQTALFTTIFFAAQQQVENHLLVPKLMQRQVGVSPVIVIVALLIGGSVLGILGALLAVPTAAILQVVTKELLDERDRLQELGERLRISST